MLKVNAKGCIYAGICGFNTVVFVSYNKKLKIAYVSIESNCERIKELSHIVQEIVPIKELTLGFSGTIMSEARKVLHGACSGCVVPVGIYKTVQVAAGFALPMTVKVEITEQ